MTTRRRNLQRLNEVEMTNPQQPTDGGDDILQRNYTLNMDKAMKKK